jgi:hypothetical protein
MIGYRSALILARRGNRSFRPTCYCDVRVAAIFPDLRPLTPGPILPGGGAAGIAPPSPRCNHTNQKLHRRKADWRERDRGYSVPACR